MDSTAPATIQVSWRAPTGGLLVAIVGGIVGGITAGAFHRVGISFVGLTPLGVGVGVGVLVVGGMSILSLGHPSWRLAFVAAVLAIVVQHWWLYVAVMDNREKQAAKQPAVELFRPGWSNESFLEYMWAEATTQTVMLWTLDACLLAVATVVIVEVGGKLRAASGE